MSSLWAVRLRIAAPNCGKSEAMTSRILPVRRVAQQASTIRCVAESRHLQRINRVPLCARSDSAVPRIIHSRFNSH